MCVTKFSNKLVNKKQEASFYFVQPLAQTFGSSLAAEEKGDGGWDFSEDRVMRKEGLEKDRRFRISFWRNYDGFVACFLA